MDAIRLDEREVEWSGVLDRVSAGQIIEISRNGRAVARVVPAGATRRRIDVTALRTLTDSLPLQSQSGADFVREMRDENRF